ncbi:MAG TPA: hypothetical protein VMZ04_08950 [Anaerolineae bacterium]|nr:hypothetical protein [Anaerolineae bacterium]
MKKRNIFFGVVFLGIIGIGAITLFTVLNFMPSNPLEGCDQFVLVLAKTQKSREAVLQTFTREGDTWRFAFSCPVVLGKNGLAWGRGLHNDRDRLDGDPVKCEGDGTSPQGAFELIHAYGYLMPSMVRIRFPYTQVTPDIICCDDVGSEYYNRVIDIEQKRLDPDNLPSHEQMLREDDLYKYTILVGHNTWRPEKGAGSCIFLHIWRGIDSYTTGCTAMEEENMLRLLSWLNQKKNPVLIQLTRKNYLRLKKEWGLPDVTI